MPNKASSPNGQYRERVQEVIQSQVTGPRVALTVWTVALTLLSAGWIVLPAKESDLKLLALQVSSLRADVQTVVAEMQHTREEVIRLSAGAIPAAAPTRKAPSPLRRAVQAGAGNKP